MDGALEAERRGCDVEGLVGVFEGDLRRFVLPEWADFLCVCAGFFGERFDVACEHPKSEGRDGIGFGGTFDGGSGGDGAGDGGSRDCDAVEGAEASVGEECGALFGESDLGCIECSAAEKSGGAFGDADPALFDIHRCDIFVADGDVEAILDSGEEFVVRKLEAQIEGFFHVDIFFNAEEESSRAPLVG